VELHSAVEKVADIFDGMDIDNDPNTFTAFTCQEITTIAEMLRVAGRIDTANQIIMYHAEGDDIGDDHYLGRQ
jgi:hypothetical protein